MKSPRNTCLVSHLTWVALLASLIFGPFFHASIANALSIGPIGRSGVVQTVEVHTPILTMMFAGERIPRLLSWNGNPRFIRNDEPVDSSALLTGPQVEVWYQDPIFAKKLVRAFRWSGDRNGLARPSVRGSERDTPYLRL